MDQPIARGRTADVFAWDETHILKLFHNWFSVENIEYEQRIAQAVIAGGVKAPRVGGIVQVRGRHGLIYERVPGVSMENMFQRKPWKFVHYAHLLAQLHAQMHECEFDATVAAQKRRIQDKIQHADALPNSLKTKLSNALETLPEGDRVCHGDFHPGNVLLSDRDATVIDWIDATRGNPLADVARTSIIALGAAQSTRNGLLKVFVRAVHSLYLRHYFQLRPGGEDEYRHWLPIIAGARLSENIDELKSWLLEQANQSM